MTSLLIVFVTAALVNNVALTQLLGLRTLFGLSNDADKARSLYLPLILTMTIASGVSHVVNTFVLAPFGLEYLRTLALVVVIAVVAWFIDLCAKDFGAELSTSLLTANCVVLGVTLLNVVNGFGFMQSVAAGFGSAVGYIIVMELMNGIRERIEENDIPAPFQGAPILFLTAALMAIAFYGFGNIAF